MSTDPSPPPAPERQAPNNQAPSNQAQRTSSSYRLPALDSKFILSDSMRGTRLMLEYEKAEERLRDWGVRSTLVTFGSARVRSPDAVATAEETARVAEFPQSTRWYAEALAFGRLASERGGALDGWPGGYRDNVIATGGGGGLMAAVNRGAWEVGAPSIGFNIALPHEQEPNPYTTPELTFQFHYFAMRKLHFAMRAAGLVIFPGGFGTLDEMFEILTLRQTGKSAPIPVVLMDKAYWTRVLDFGLLAKTGMISAADLELFSFADDAEGIWRALVAHGLKVPRQHAPDTSPAFQNP
ncbi:LOG family protein [Nitrospirillum sp. BR 11828]|uniref:LOG family protein n=1 Tax=Nitrospirillum sp. BR 11828 TaxID=3104325 RepID=UPI002ACA902F|nr:LOG family protein [Nitrospirillum sp. BR 11828]MDZ5648573.1 LOG family protein [Nitrospirillum sp. BR 11828]